MPVPNRAARSRTTNPPAPLGVMTISGSFGSLGSLLKPVTAKVPGAIPEARSAVVTVATGTILWLGGQRLQPAPGMPEIVGADLSILIVTCAELVRPAPLVAEQVSVVPGVLAVNV